MKAYLAIKYREDLNNKGLIEDISKMLEKVGFETTAILRDYEKWGKVKFSSRDLMKLAFRLIEESDLLMIEFSEKGVGLGIEAGYAFAKNIPIIVIAKEGSDISDTLRGIAKEVIFYKETRDLLTKFKDVKI